MLWRGVLRVCPGGRKRRLQRHRLRTALVDRCGDYHESPVIGAEALADPPPAARCCTTGKSSRRRF